MKIFLLNLLVAFLLPVSLSANNADDAWLEDDSEWRALQVNEGQLTFIDELPDASVLHSDTHLWITEDSLSSGWVKMQQCYRQLDAVGRTDVVYAYAEMRKLEITHTEKIAQTRVKQNRIELEDVEKAAELCVTSEVRILRCSSNKICSIDNGPYHRKFLDGYYPYHVSLSVHYPVSYLALESIEPGQQKGVAVKKTTGKVNIDCWFEGELMISLRFRSES